MGKFVGSGKIGLLMVVMWLTGIIESLAFVANVYCRLYNIVQIRLFWKDRMADGGLVDGNHCVSSIPEFTGSVSRSLAFSVSSVYNTSGH